MDILDMDMDMDMAEGMDTAEIWVEKPDMDTESEVSKLENGKPQIKLDYFIAQ